MATRGETAFRKLALWAGFGGTIVASVATAIIVNLLNKKT